MSVKPIDTSLTGYTSGSVDRQDAIYRNRKRPQPYPLINNDSGYETASYLHLGKAQASSAPSLLGLADSVKCTELLNNDSNFAVESMVGCYQSDVRYTECVWRF